MTDGEAYLDIVWKQFRKNRPALVSLWLLGLLSLVALMAPLIGSDQPLVFHDGDQTLFPWFHALFHPIAIVDFPFNMALLGFVPWLLGASIWNLWAKRREIPGRRRVMAIAGAYLVLTVLLTAVFASPNWRPSAYFDRTFTQEQWDHPQQCRGTYALVPYGPQEGDLDVCKMRPLYRKPSDSWKQSNSGFVHLLGTDSGGRDVLVQLVYGTRIALTVGIVAVSIYTVIGIVVGALAGYFGGAVDMILSRLIEIVLLFPTFFLILTLVGLLGDRSRRHENLSHHGRDWFNQLANHRPTHSRRSAEATGVGLHHFRAGAGSPQRTDYFPPHFAQRLGAGDGRHSLRHRQRHCH